MKQILLLFSLIFFCTASVQAQLPTPYLLYPYPNGELAFVQEQFTFMWKIDSLKYPPEGKDYKYDFLITTIEKGQKPQEAIEKNPPLCFTPNISSYYFNYPWNAPKLPNGSYVWRITAKKILGKDSIKVYSDLNVFNINDQHPRMALGFSYPNYHTELREKPDAPFQVAFDSKLLIKYEELYEVGSSQSLRFKVYDSTGTVIIQTDENGTVQANSAPNVPIQTGINYLTLNFETAIPVSWGKFYLLEVWNAKSERWYLRFTTAYSEATRVVIPFRNFFN